MTTVASVLVMLIALVHSVLGERGLLMPLFEADWEIGEMPRWVAERILRFAWHLTSVAWVALALSALGVAPLLTLAGCALLSALIVLVSLPGHLAWPLFLAAGVSALMAAGQWPEALSVTVVACGILISLVAAAVHMYWALGGRRGFRVALPGNANGEPLWTPPRALVWAVALVLVGFALLLSAPLWGMQSGWLRGLLIAGTVVLTLRAVGDGKLVGFTKREHSTRFAQLDDALYTPLVVCMAMAAAMATMQAGALAA